MFSHADLVLLMLVWYSRDIVAIVTGEGDISKNLVPFVVNCFFFFFRRSVGKKKKHLSITVIFFSSDAHDVNRVAHES